ncbi:hypothetical protein N0V90_002549 [Kalmusia sp. IMI 367209]|nr:hypothetical protein N0V90_002549 [Kalmusia sp. IMI 367209]
MNSSASGAAVRESCSSNSSARLQPFPTTAAAPAPRTFFDPWNSSSTGHQRAENRLSGSTSWRESRSLKLAEQFKGGLGGGKRVADTVGAGSADFGKDGRKANGGWERGAKGLRTGGQKSLAEVWGQSKASITVKRSSQEEKHIVEDVGSQTESISGTEEGATIDDGYDTETGPEPRHLAKPLEKQIFRGLCFYLNGSTMPLISDHKLKYLLSIHGAGHSIALGRRTVTHVILGNTCGGGLSGSKLQKEITRIGGKAVKFITAEWVLESIKAAKRLPESRFSPLKLAPNGQDSVTGNLLPGHPPAG